MRNYSLIICFCFSRLFISAQVNYPRDYFGSPVKIPITLAGNFGEIRPNHFHAGFDIRTNGREGLPVYAVADGYVSRIKISPVGYGKALYITHPNGYVSVYGHLKVFNTAIQAKATTFQNLLQSFELDTLINRTLLPVKKGELIGFSGSTGSSQAPHLHFEIREEQTEMPVNPYFFGYKVDDLVPPVITGITVYPQSAQAQINGKHVIKNLVPHKINGKYSIAKADSLTLSGEIGFGIQCYDKENAGSGTNNVFSVEMLSGGKRLFYFEMDKFSFDNARYVNAHIDYPQKEKRHRIIQKCFLSKNNPLSIYKGVINRGIINFDDNSIHWITFIVRDYAGNSSELVLKITGKYADKNKVQTDTAFNCLKENKFIRPDIRVNIPAEALYDDLNFNFKTAPAVKSTFSPLYYLADETVALQKSITININADALPEELQNKACIVSVERGKLSYEAGVYTYGYVLTETKHFGKFAISADTIPPKIIPLTKFPVTASIADFRNLKSLRFRSTDDLSGIKKYRATIDGSWVLCEYDAKNDLLFHTFDDSVSEGVHQFKLEVTDDKGNSKEWKMMFKR